MEALRIQEDVKLADWTNYKIGGSARYFAEVRTHEELLQALEFARSRDLEIFVLAGGTNIVISDHGFDGLVIKVEISQLRLESRKVVAGAAVSIGRLVDETISAGLAGLEWAGGLPGTLGGAIRGNAGAFGGEIKDTVGSVTSVEIDTGRSITRSNKECRFSYRHSIFKEVKEIIVSAELGLTSGDPAVLREIADDHIAFRARRHPLEYPNGGSVFKNVPYESLNESAKKHFKDFVKTDPFPVVPSGKIIEDAGLKGARVGDAQISPKHCNYFVNLNRASSRDIKALIDKAKRAVKEKFGIELELEQVLVN